MYETEENADMYLADLRENCDNDKRRNSRVGATASRAGGPRTVGSVEFSESRFLQEFS